MLHPWMSRSISKHFEMELLTSCTIYQYHWQLVEEACNLHSGRSSAAGTMISTQHTICVPTILQFALCSVLQYSLTLQTQHVLYSYVDMQK